MNISLEYMIGEWSIMYIKFGKTLIIGASVNVNKDGGKCSFLQFSELFWQLKVLFQYIL